ncbi:ATP-binding cassette domain-containing protein [Anaerocolumna sedimenticola]|uniref:ATP-binding cassette domain-containing protein n=1 Tax=Anaerocolumna sedimenticola TaxID=2696063 RepID=A0A6P1TRF5_9FIRM|nr:sugar ABC transporter ATP-binding protein [Anaerocolumna sedimenticola]QHQ62839.1 ATP-binding cassette domain-containing protein [Anaerocolumna sedimenticola]
MGKILELEHISKFYPGVVALDDVSFFIEEGQVHALMGENGAGKSTLIKVISGAIKPEQGHINISGERFDSLTPALSKDKGVGVIYQEFNLVPTMSVVENIFLGEKIGGSIIPDFEEMQRKAQDIFDEFGVDIDPKVMVGELTPGKQQLVEIAKTLTRNVKLIIMDEPSASISVADVQTLFRIIGQLKEKGVTIIYISHRMEEVFEIADVVSIMRDGRYVGTKSMKEVSRKDLITMMVGRELNESYPVREKNVGEVVLEVEHLYGNGNSDINFCLHKGEILGIAGLVGAGRTELAKVIYGAAKAEHGMIRVNGKEMKIKTPHDAIAAGIGYIPEDRKNEGAFLEFPIDWNISIMSLSRLSKGMVVAVKKIDELAVEFQQKLGIKTPTIKQYVKNLSGGNQQKVVVAKTLATDSKIVIFDEPTRGIDVGAKQEIYQLMNSLIEQGISIIMISSEMEELIGMSDRIIIMHEGAITGELQKEEFSQNKILEYASGL